MSGARTAGVPVPTRVPVTSWKLLPTLLLCASAVLLFGFDYPWAGYATVAVSLVTAALVDRLLLKDLALIAAGLVIISTVPLDADLSIGHMAAMGFVLALAVIVPYVVSRYVYKDHAIRFPILTGKRWSRLEVGYLLLVVVLGYLILPYYLISTGVYLNWPDASDPSVFVRLFIGVNTVGIWDELFFICTTFTLLRRHFRDWQANVLQAIIFSSFLWEIGYQAWGPLLTFPFAMLQGYTFKLTKSLTYVVCVHLIFDFVLFLVLVHAHNPDWLPIFIY
ncbi:MAG TPA: CPBP family intramembrane glutamic endopeptidase [Glaciibacter sp.]|nr:CPBP family intramembrane glutamic endopeptidase [Glaciibacter sp.]